jgi:acylphosphatase
LYAGHVQGVGFRYTVRHLAGGFQVSGFVRNLADGRVEVVAEGTPAELTGFWRRSPSEWHTILATSRSTLAREPANLISSKSAIRSAP